jgi:hypothetical protein
VEVEEGRRVDVTVEVFFVLGLTEEDLEEDFLQDEVDEGRRVEVPVDVFRVLVFMEEDLEAGRVEVDVDRSVEELMDEHSLSWKMIGLL